MKSGMALVFFGALTLSVMAAAERKCFTLTKVTLPGENLEITGWKNIGQCTCHEAKSGAEAVGAPGTYIPACDSDGKYSERQFSASSGQSWCVDKETGHQIKAFVNPGSPTPDHC
ncbi:equistatin-like [Paramacrobiotus metropolitanus]|uniref:equistatin-like n=1 Tax=Paramacrobiotus metropolitanus TaxID=2943436 RepID=UPI00244649DC|nr:equistatin-like [Paramacrobiotus metropolitanus]